MVTATVMVENNRLAPAPLPVSAGTTANPLVARPKTQGAMGSTRRLKIFRPCALVPCTACCTGSRRGVPGWKAMSTSQAAAVIACTR